MTDRLAPSEAAPARVVVVILAGITAVSLAVLALIWRRNPPPSLEFELAKVCMQVLGVAVIGSVAAIATFLFQRRRIESAEMHLKQREEQREDWRRDVDNRIDERHRRDELLRSLLEQAVTAYNAVKRTRRLLEAETGGEVGQVSIDVYDRHLAELNDRQLTFEGLKRIAPILDDERLTTTVPTISAPLGAEFGKIEHYLNQVVQEYQTMRRQVAAAGGVPLPQLKKLHSFVVDTGGFKAGASNPINSVVGTLGRSLLTPVRLPKVEDVGTQ